VTKKATVVFDTIEVILATLEAVTWPALTGAGGENLNTAGTSVVFGTLVQEPDRETVAVTGSVDDQDQSQWPEVGLAAKREAFTTELLVVTQIPNRTAAEAWARMKSLVTTIGATFRDLNTGRPIVPAALAALGVYTISTTTTRTALYPSTDGAFVCSAGVALGVKADI